MNSPLGLMILIIAAFVASYFFRKARAQLTPEQKAALFDVQNAQYSLNLYGVVSLIFFGGLYLLITYLHLQLMLAILITLPFLFLLGVVRNIVYYRQLKAKNVPQAYLNAMITAMAVILIGLFAYVMIIYLNQGMPPQVIN